LMQSFSRQSGSNWAQAVAQTCALKEVHQQMLEALKVGQPAGAGTPYLLNVSDDPALSGCLLYWLKPAPEVNDVGQEGSVCLRGLGIPARLCELTYRPEDASVSIRKCTESGRLLVNGRPVVDSQLQHADRLVFGWAFCFRLVISAGRESGASPAPSTDFEHISQEALEHSKTSTLGDLGAMRAAAHWQAELQRRNVADADSLMDSVGELLLKVEEANVLCRELQEAVPGAAAVELDVGLCFGWRPNARPPAPVVQVWKRSEGRLIAVWPGEDFQRRLVTLQDAHRAALKREVRGRWAWRLSRDEWWAGEAQGEQENSGPDSEAEEEPASSAVLEFG